MAPRNTSLAHRQPLLRDGQHVTLKANVTDPGVTVQRAVIAYLCRAIPNTAPIPLANEHLIIPNTTPDTLATMVAYSRAVCARNPIARFTDLHQRNELSLIDLVATACALKMDLEFIGLQGRVEARLELEFPCGLIELWDVARLKNCNYLKLCSEAAFAKSLTQCSNRELLDAWDVAAAQSPSTTTPRT